MKQIHALAILLILLLTVNSGCSKDPNEIIEPTNPLDTQLIAPTSPPAFLKLSRPRDAVVAAATHSKLLIAGGMERGVSSNGLLPALTIVDIYDSETQELSVAHLSKARYSITAIAHQEKVFFAGGMERSDHTKASTRVDIYDAKTNSWSTAELSEPRCGIIAAASGNKVIFSGGYNQNDNYTLMFSRRVDIYDISTNTWTTATMTEPRISHSASVVENKIYIAGGERPNINPAIDIYVNVNGFDTFSLNQSIDVYDVATNTWTKSLLSRARARHSAAVVDDAIYWIGGTDGESGKSMEVLNTRTHITTQHLNSHQHSYANLPALNRNKNITIFSTDGWHHTAETFDLETGHWLKKVFPAFTYLYAYAVLDDAVYMTDGVTVWKETF